MGHLLVEMATDVHFLLGVVEDLVTRAAQHRLDTRAIWHPPICRVVRIAMLDEVREAPREMLTDLVARRRQTDPSFQPPFLLRAVQWTFLDNPKAKTFGKAAAALLGKRSREKG